MRVGVPILHSQPQPLYSAFLSETALWSKEAEITPVIEMKFQMELGSVICALSGFSRCGVQGPSLSVQISARQFT